MSEQVRDPAAAAKARQRGLTVLERKAEEQRIAAEKEDARRPRAASAVSRRRVVVAERRTVERRCVGAGGSGSTRQKGDRNRVLLVYKISIRVPRNILVVVQRPEREKG